MILTILTTLTSILICIDVATSVIVSDNLKTITFHVNDRRRYMDDLKRWYSSQTDKIVTLDEESLTSREKLGEEIKGDKTTEGQSRSKEQQQVQKVSVKNPKAWFGTKQALKNINLDVKEKTVTAFIGYQGEIRRSFIITNKRCSLLINMKIRNSSPGFGTPLTEEEIRNFWVIAYTISTLERLITKEIRIFIQRGITLMSVTISFTLRLPRTRRK
jgi:Skp family chaperone for outer membrane proteins